MQDTAMPVPQPVFRHVRLPWDRLRKNAADITKAAAAADTSTTEQTIDVDADGCCWTQLHYAAAAGCVSLVKRSLDAGIAVDCKGYQDFTPLMCAAKYGCTAVVDFLLTEGADVNATDKLGMTALHVAASEGHIAVMKQLITPAGARAEDSMGCTPLHCALEAVFDDIIIDAAELLLNNQADVNARDNMGKTALHKAVEQGSGEVAKFLISRGAAVHAMDDEGQTPLMVALSNEAWWDSRIVKVLLEGGRPWDLERLTSAAQAAVDGQKWTGFALLAKEIYSDRRYDFHSAMAMEELPEIEYAHSAFWGAIEEWYSDMVSHQRLDEERAQLAEQRRELEAQRRAFQHLIISGAHLLKQVVEQSGTAQRDVHQE